jgi:hypothetical protein
MERLTTKPEPITSEKKTREQGSKWGSVKKERERERRRVWDWIETRARVF